MAAVFIGQATNIPMTLPAQMVLLLTSTGGAGVVGSGFIVLAVTLSAAGHVAAAGLARIPGIDCFMYEGRALTNFIGNGVAPMVVARWPGNLHTVRMQPLLDNETAVEAGAHKKVLDAAEAPMPAGATRG